MTNNQTRGFKLTKREACALLSISPKTLQRRINKGQYKFTRIGEGQYAELSFTHADLGLPEPEPTPTPTPVAPAVTPAVETAPAVPEPEPKIAPAQLGPIELQREADQRFADDYKRGLVTDSAGNTINGTNERWPTKGVQSLLGPLEAKPREKFSCNSHMSDYWRMNDQPQVGWNGEVIVDASSDSHPLNRERVLREQAIKSTPTRQPHPNQSRQDMLNQIWADIRRGYSR